MALMCKMEEKEKVKVKEISNVVKDMEIVGLRIQKPKYCFCLQLLL